MYDCEKENQIYLNQLNIKSNCCQSSLTANSLDEWFCDSCGTKIV